MLCDQAECRSSQDYPKFTVHIAVEKLNNCLKPFFQVDAADDVGDVQRGHRGPGGALRRRVGTPGAQDHLQGRRPQRLPLRQDARRQGRVV